MTLTFADPAELSDAELEEGEVFAPRFDDKGLITAIAVEAETNVVLMVGHMNAEALAATIESGEATYFSRSRQKLWKKGETSGETQQVVELRTDCDQDAIVLVVRQRGRGAACHTGRKTCFYRRLHLGTEAPSLIDTGEPRLFDPKQVYG